MKSNYFVIDIGNTDTVCALFSENEILKKFRVATTGYSTPDECYVKLKMFLTDYEIASIKKVVIGSVVPRANSSFDRTFNDYFNITPHFVSGNYMINVTVDRTGADRIANIIAASTEFAGKDLLIVDIGTATTFDLVDSNSTFFGAVISPGPGTLITAFRSTAMLPSICLKKNSTTINDKLFGSLESGVFYGYVGLLNNIIKNIFNEVKKDMIVILTGGYCFSFNEELDIPSNGILKIDQDLTIKGLRIIADVS